MTVFNEAKKTIEARALAAARQAGVPIPLGEIPGEGPDFTFITGTGTLGVEVSGLVRPATCGGGILPVAAAAYHQQVVEMAEEEYYRAGGMPARVTVCFSDSKGKRRNKRQLARHLAEFVKANLQRANPVANFGQRELPDGFSTMAIASGTGRWYCGESGAVTLSDIRETLTRAIGEKDKLVPRYRENLETGAQVWLLLYTTADVARGMPIPCGVEEWRFDFGFDRVFWFAGLERRFAEIHRAKSAGPAKA